MKKPRRFYVHLDSYTVSNKYDEHENGPGDDAIEVVEVLQPPKNKGDAMKDFRLKTVTTEITLSIDTADAECLYVGVENLFEEDTYEVGTWISYENMKDMIDWLIEAQNEIGEAYVRKT